MASIMESNPATIELVLVIDVLICLPIVWFQFIYRLWECSSMLLNRLTEVREITYLFILALSSPEAKSAGKRPAICYKCSFTVTAAYPRSWCHSPQDTEIVTDVSLIWLPLGFGKLFPKNHLLFYSFILRYIEPIILSKVAHYFQIILNNVCSIKLRVV